MYNGAVREVKAGNGSRYWEASRDWVDLTEHSLFSAPSSCLHFFSGLMSKCFYLMSRVLRVSRTDGR